MQKRLTPLFKVEKIREMRFIYMPQHLKQKGGHFLHRFIVPLVLISPIMTLPQVLKVWASGQVEGVSIYTWGGYAVGTLFWVIYGYIHKEKLVLWVNAFLFLMDVLIVIGVLVHRI